MKRYSMVRYVLILAVAFSLSSCSVLRMHKPSLSKKGIESNRIYLHYKCYDGCYHNSGCASMVYYPEGRYVHLSNMLLGFHTTELPFDMIEDLSEYLKYLVDYESDLQTNRGYTLPEGEIRDIKRFEHKGAFVSNYLGYASLGSSEGFLLKEVIIDVGVFTSDGKCYTYFEAIDKADHSTLGYTLIDIQNTQEFYGALDHMLYLYNK